MKCLGFIGWAQWSLLLAGGLGLASSCDPVVETFPTVKS